MKLDMLSAKNLRVLTRSSCAYGFGNAVTPMLTRFSHLSCLLMWLFSACIIHTLSESVTICITSISCWEGMLGNSAFMLSSFAKAVFDYVYGTCVGCLHHTVM